MFGLSFVIHFFLSLNRASVFYFLVFPSISGLLFIFSSSLFFVSSWYYFYTSYYFIFFFATWISFSVGLFGQNLNILFLKLISSSSIVSLTRSSYVFSAIISSDFSSSFLSNSCAFLIISSC